MKSNHRWQQSSNIRFHVLYQHLFNDSWSKNCNWHLINMHCKLAFVYSTPLSPPVISPICWPVHSFSFYWDIQRYLLQWNLDMNGNNGHAMNSLSIQKKKEKRWTAHLSESVKNRFPSTIVIVCSGSGWMLYVDMPIWKMARSEHDCRVSVYKLSLYTVFGSFLYKKSMSFSCEEVLVSFSSVTRQNNTKHVDRHTVSVSWRLSVSLIQNNASKESRQQF